MCAKKKYLREAGDVGLGIKRASRGFFFSTAAAVAIVLGIIIIIK